MEKSISIFDEQIDKALHSDLQFLNDEHSKNLRMSQAQARNLLAIAYFRDGKQIESVPTFERAYQEASAIKIAPD